MQKLTSVGIALLLSVAPGSAESASAQLGISGGLNFAQLDDIDAGDSDATFESSTGWHLHLWADLPMGPFALRPGVRVMDMGKLFEDASLDDPPDPFDDENVRLLEIPVDVRLRLGSSAIRPYAMAGPVFRFNTGSDDDERFRSFSLAGGAGGGIEIGVGGMTFYPELKYTFGITRFTEESYELGGVTISADEDQQLNAVMISLGIGLRLDTPAPPLSEIPARARFRSPVNPSGAKVLIPTARAGPSQRRRFGRGR